MAAIRSRRPVAHADDTARHGKPCAASSAGNIVGRVADDVGGFNVDVAPLSRPWSDLGERVLDDDQASVVARIAESLVPLTGSVGGVGRWRAAPVRSASCGRACVGGWLFGRSIFIARVSSVCRCRATATVAPGPCTWRDRSGKDQSGMAARGILLGLGLAGFQCRRVRVRVGGRWGARWRNIRPLAPEALEHSLGTVRGRAI